MLCWNVLGRRCRFFTEVRDIYSKKFPELLGKKPENLRSFPASGCVDVQQLLFRVIIDHIVSESWRMINSMKGLNSSSNMFYTKRNNEHVKEFPVPLQFCWSMIGLFTSSLEGVQFSLTRWCHGAMCVVCLWLCMKAAQVVGFIFMILPAIYKCFSGPWIPMVLNPHGTSFCAMVHVGSTGRYLTSSGTWNQRLLGALLRLESIVTSPLDYLQVVQRIGNTKARGRSCGW